MNVRTALSAATLSLKDAGIDTARLDAELLLAQIFGIARFDLVLQGDTDITDDQANAFEALLARRRTHEPMAHILGSREFWSLDFAVNQHTLVPRPDSETLVEAVIKSVQDADPMAPFRILDLGTGSGCLLLAILSELKGGHGLGVDISNDALLVAQRNAQALGMAERAEFQPFDYMQASGLDGFGDFDIIISNPPYIESADIATLDEEVRDFDPHGALDGGTDGLDHYRRLADITRNWLRPNGRLFLEVGAGQAGPVSKILAQNDWDDVAIYKDLAGVERALGARYFGRNDG